MPIKTYKGKKNNKTPKLRINVEKGTSNFIESQTMKQDARNQQRWEALKKRYEYKGDEE